MASAWTYDTQVIEYEGNSNVIGTRPGTTYSYRVGVITNDAFEAQDLSVNLNYHDGFIGQYLFSLDNGDTWLEIDKEAENFTLSDVSADQVILLRAVIVYYRYLSTSPWGDADEALGDEYYFAFPPGGQYFNRGTTDVNKTGFVAVANNRDADRDFDGQSVNDGDCNDSDNTIYTGADEICEDGVDQNCDGVDDSCGPPTVTSAGQVWMDRNLGASRVATSSADPEAYGDLYQWGRLADGHEDRTSSTTSNLSATDVPGHGDFIIVGSDPFDWRTERSDHLWQSEPGTNNPCPSGFRLPMETELDTERTSWDTNDVAGAYGSPTKLVVAGFRNVDGMILNTVTNGYYASSTVNGRLNDYLRFHSGEANVQSTWRSCGMSVRCIKD